MKIVEDGEFCMIVKKQVDCAEVERLLAVVWQGCDALYATKLDPAAQAVVHRGARDAYRKALEALRR